jgi:hypothetical protein
VADFEDGMSLEPWTSGAVVTEVTPPVAERAAVPGMGGKCCAVSRAAGRGWADWESPYLRVDAGKRYAVRFSARISTRTGTVRVLLFKYDRERLPLDLPDRARGALGPALLGQLDSTDRWEQRRFPRQIEPGVGLVRLYFQCFGLDGEAAFDDVAVAEFEADPSLVDDGDEIGGWKPGFPEARVTRETTQVHQGAAAINFTVSIDHHGGEAKYPKGWPHLRWLPSPPLDWTGKKTLTFWVYASSSRPALPAQAVTLSIQSEAGDGLALPLTFPKDTWQQVTVPLAGKRLSAVKHLEFFVSESVYDHGDRVTFIIDDMRVSE